MRQRPLPLQAELVRALIRERFGSVDDLVIQWQEARRIGKQRAGRPRERATLYRWLDNGVPSNRSDIFGLAGMLDADPVSLLRIDERLVTRYFRMERARVSLETLNRNGLAAFWALYAPGPAWPPDSIARDYFDREWSAHEFAHDHRMATNAYVTVGLDSDLGRASSQPRAYHFAYRRTGARDGMWRPYGTVLGYDDKALLISESGDFQSLQTAGANRRIAVDTYFGAGEAEFRVASLHDFRLLLAPASDDGDRLRFHA